MICLLCLLLLVIWTSPKLNVSMVNWLADCRFNLDYRSVAGPDKIQQISKSMVVCLP